MNTTVKTLKNEHETLTVVVENKDKLFDVAGQKIERGIGFVSNFFLHTETDNNLGIVYKIVNEDETVFYAIFFVRDSCLFAVYRRASDDFCNATKLLRVACKKDGKQTKFLNQLKKEGKEVKVKKDSHMDERGSW